MSMKVSRSDRQIRITQHNSGEIARKALFTACCVGLGALVALLIYAVLLVRFLSGAVPMAEFVIATIILLPGGLGLILAASAELAIVLPRQIVVDANHGPFLNPISVFQAHHARLFTVGTRRSHGEEAH